MYNEFGIEKCLYTKMSTELFMVEFSYIDMTKYLLKHIIVESLHTFAPLSGGFEGWTRGA